MWYDGENGKGGIAHAAGGIFAADENTAGCGIPGFFIPGNSDLRDSSSAMRIKNISSECENDLDDIKSWLQECKFEIVAVYEEMTRDNVRADTQRAVFIARKHGTQ